MQELKLKASYDSKEDVLLLHSKSKVKESIEVSAGIVIDLDKEDNLAGLEIMDAQEFLGQDNRDITKELLENCEQITAIIKNFRNYIYISLVFIHNKKTIVEKLPPFPITEYETPLLTAAT